MKILYAVLCTIILAGCSSVTIQEPFPESPLTAQERQQLTGTWQLEGSVWQVAFTSNGIPWMAAVEWKDEDFRIRKSRLYFTKHNAALYVCMPTEPDRENEFLFAEIKPADNGKSVNAWGPNIDYFSGLVENGQLKGSVNKGEHAVTVRLESPAVEILGLISTNHATLNYKTPLLFQKLD